MVKVKNDLTGMIFDRLTVIEQVEDYISPKGERKAQWLCECSCEEHNQIVVTGNALIKGHTKSCGCLHNEHMKYLHDLNHKTNKYNLSGEYGIGWTSNTDKEFYFDLEDYDKIKDICWMECINQKTGYRYLAGMNRKTQKHVKMHVLLGFAHYDHADRNTLNNRKSNFRFATTSQQDMNRNKQSNNTSGFIGVSWHKGKNKWETSINVNKRHVYLGAFDNKKDAIVTRLNAEAKYYKEFAPQRHLFEQYGIISPDKEGNNEL